MNARLAIPLIATITLYGCFNPKIDTGGISLPDWVLQPTIADGIAATSCVRWTGDFDLDRKASLASARQELAQQIQLRVQSMDETYLRKVEATAGDVRSNVFESVSRQLTDLALQGSVPERVQPVKFDDGQRLCTQVTMRPDATRALFQKLVAASGEQLTPQDEAVLFEEFKASQARARMDEALAR